MPYLCWHRHETGFEYNTLSVTRLDIKQNQMSWLWLKLSKDNGNLFLYNQYYLSSTSISIFYACYHFTILFRIQFLYRYIGAIANMLSKVPQLSYIHSIAVSEVIIRSTKHIFTAFLQGLELTHLSIGVAHFLNCFLSSSSSVTVTLSDELKSLTGSSSSRNKKRRNGTRTKQPSGKDPFTMYDFHNSTDIFVNTSFLPFCTQKVP